MKTQTFPEALAAAIIKTQPRVLSFMLNDAELSLVNQIAQNHKTLPQKIVLQMVRQTPVPATRAPRAPYRRPNAPEGQQRKHTLKIAVVGDDYNHLKRLVDASGGNQNLTISRLLAEVAQNTRTICFK